jgi:dihydropyrimidine dehydrogenase (NAD+) subunit PreT
MSCARVCPVEVLCVGDCVYNLLHARRSRSASSSATPPTTPTPRAGASSRRASTRARASASSARGPRAWPALTSCAAAATACTDLREAPGGGRPQHHRRRAVQDEGRPGAEEVDWVLGIGGIDVKTGVNVGEHVSSRSSRRVTTRCSSGDRPRPRHAAADVPGEDLPGVRGAVDFIERDEARPGRASRG